MTDRFLLLRKATTEKYYEEVDRSNVRGFNHRTLGLIPVERLRFCCKLYSVGTLDLDSGLLPRRRSLLLQLHPKGILMHTTEEWSRHRNSRLYQSGIDRILLDRRRMRIAIWFPTDSWGGSSGVI